MWRAMAWHSALQHTNTRLKESSMSGHGFHVHGPHDHELEHATQGHGGAHTNSIAMFTAIIATVGALFGYMGGATQANAGLYKNNAAIKKTEASNQWNYYQAKSSKQNLSELAMELTPLKKDFYLDEVKRYKSEKSEIKVAAEKLEAESKHWDEQSDEQMHQHHRWAQATTVLQVAIAMAAIALLSKKKWLEYVMYAAGGIGMVVGGLAAFHI
jgi:Na+/glutamate symporter